MRLEKDWYDSTKAIYAFVYLKTPDLAKQVKQQIAKNLLQILGESSILVINLGKQEIKMIHEIEALDSLAYFKAT